MTYIADFRVLHMLVVALLVRGVFNLVLFHLQGVSKDSPDSTLTCLTLTLLIQMGGPCVSAFLSQVPSDSYIIY